MANITRYSPFSEIVSLREAMDRLFEESFIPRLGFGGRGVASNLYETGDHFVLQIPMPGVDPNAVEITAQQDTLHLKWQTSVKVPENASTHWSGFAEGQYEQSFTLPAPINADAVEATYENGILNLTLPKAEHAKARIVKVVTKH
ncbi:MAG TPA: Hsp20/alpha crystallin family protein [Ktedonobacteraceae bacterium]|jgi:HSP20 family protein|nr:Hsp20/alpha crystallin family protein [Ktedonobacteraceae bacterium]